MSEVPRKPATRDDVAARAGVSTALVSYFITGARVVSAASAERIRTAIGDLDYRPNWTAQALKTGRTRTLGLIVTDIENPYFAALALEIERRAANRGYAVVLANTQANDEAERNHIQDLLDRGVDGLILGSHNDDRPITELSSTATHVVRIDVTTGHEGVTAIGPSMAEGADEVVTHLVERHGFRDIALALGGGGGDEIELDQRQVGWITALQRAGLPEARVVRTEWSRSGGYESGALLLDTPARPEAVFAGSDLIAVGLLRAAADRGLKVPGDLALASFDGSPESEYSVPRLTSLQQPVPEMAEAAIKAVLSKTPLTGFSSFRGLLLIRESCGYTGRESGPQG